jgi:hypothetical protein
MIFGGEKMGRFASLNGRKRPLIPFPSENYTLEAEPM